MTRGKPSVLFEIAIMVGAVLGVGYLIYPGDPAFLSANPHPFWAVVLLIALRYGNPYGAIAGIVCGCLQVGYLLHALKGMSLAEIFHTEGKELIAPMLYVVVGGLVAEAIHSEVKRALFFREESDRLRDRLDSTEQQRAELEAAYRQVEGRIAGQTNTVIALYENLRYFDDLEEREIYRALATVLDRFVGVEETGVWIRGESHRHEEEDQEGETRVLWRHVLGKPGKEGHMPQLARAALRENRILTAREIFGTGAAPPTEGVLAGPIRGGDGGAVAVVTAQRMRFRDLNAQTIRFFELILYWASRSLEREELRITAGGQHVYDDDMGLTSELFFRAVVAKDLFAMKRSGQKASILVCYPEGSLPPRIKRRVRILIAACLRHLVRSSDTTAYLRREDLFVLHLPNTDLFQAKFVRGKLEKRLDTFEIQPHHDDKALRVHYGIHEMNEKTDLDQLIRIASQQRERSAS